MTTLEPVRVVVIGAGSIGTYGHVPSLKKVPGVSVVGICDANGDRARAAAESLGIPRAYEDWREVVANNEVDAITVGVPNAFHAPISIGALQAGKHVLCEKPLAMNAQEGEQMVAAAQSNNKVLAVNLNNRLRGDIQMLRAEVERGRFGKVYYVSSRLIRRAGIPGFGSWFTRKDMAGGGALLDIGVHYLDMALFVVGFPKIAGVHGIIASEHGPQGRGLGGWGADRVTGGVFDVDDFASVTLRLADGGTIKTEVTWAAHAPNEERIQLFGDKAGADISTDRYGADTPIRFYSTEESGMDLDSTPSLPPRQNAWELSVAGFINAIRGTGRPAATGAEALEVQRILDAVYRSASEGREVAL